MKSNAVFNSELYSLRRFDAKRMFYQDNLTTLQMEVFETKLSEIVFNSEFYSLIRFDEKRLVYQDILIIWKKQDINTH